MKYTTIQESNNVCTVTLIIFQNYSKMLLSNSIDALNYLA